MWSNPLSGENKTNREGLDSISPFDYGISIALTMSMKRLVDALLYILRCFVPCSRLPAFHSQMPTTISSRLLYYRFHNWHMYMTALLDVIKSCFIQQWGHFHVSNPDVSCYRAVRIEMPAGGMTFSDLWSHWKPDQHKTDPPMEENYLHLYFTLKKTNSTF